MVTLPTALMVAARTLVQAVVEEIVAGAAMIVVRGVQEPAKVTAPVNV